MSVSDYLARARLQEVRDGISELEVHKLAYFLQLFGAPMRLSFTRGRYGPFAENLPHLLTTLEGHYLSGLGDRSSRVTEFAPINPTPGSAEEARHLLADHPVEGERIAAMLHLVEGFETPYGLELLATVHFAAHCDPVSRDWHVISDRVANWSLRKARLFTEDHVRLAADRLAANALLPS